MSKPRKPKPVRTTIRRNTWPPEERAEYDAVMATVTAHSKSTSLRIDLFEKLLNDGIQAHRIWAHDVERGIRRDGMGAEIRRYEDRIQAMMSYKGEILNVPNIQSFRRKSVSGEVTYQRELIEMCPWDEIADKRREALKALGTYTVKVAHYDKLLALRDLCPDAASPAEACTKLEITVGGWLSGGLPKAA